MKASIVTTAFVCMFGLGVASADTPGPSMTGCLKEGGASGMFRLTDIENGPQTIEIAEATVNLTPHVGHKVELTGTTIAGTDPTMHTMKVTAVKHVAASCP